MPALPQGPACWLPPLRLLSPLQPPRPAWIPSSLLPPQRQAAPGRLPRWQRQPVHRPFRDLRTSSAFSCCKLFQLQDERSGTILPPAQKSNQACSLSDTLLATRIQASWTGAYGILASSHSTLHTFALPKGHSSENALQQKQGRCDF